MPEKQTRYPQRAMKNPQIGDRRPTRGQKMAGDRAKNSQGNQLRLVHTIANNASGTYKTFSSPSNCTYDVWRNLTFNIIFGTI